MQITCNNNVMGQHTGKEAKKTKDNWAAVGERKRADREQILNRHPEWRLKRVVPDSQKNITTVIAEELSSEELAIVRCDATALVEHLRLGRMKAMEVIKAVCHAATLAQDLTNCLSEICFDEALARAEELDAYFAEHGQVVGPLHGLPVSIKDHIKVKGLDTATGYVAWCYSKKADKDAVAVSILRQAGAIIYVKTNNPQTLLSLETDNNIYGKTLNPYNRDLTAGGSSGGESALIALLGSPLGIGTDIGGSIRLPAACTGLYGLKGSVSRMPHAGLVGSHDGMDAIVGALGPISRSARDLSLFCSVMLQYEPWLIEPPLLEIPWKHDVIDEIGNFSKMNFAILWDDGVVTPHPPIQAALKRVKERLVEAGHNIIDWIPINHKEAWDLIVKLYFLDGGKEYREVLAESGEPPTEQVKWILEQVPNNGNPFSVDQIFELNLQREAFRVQLAEHWNKTKDRTVNGMPIDGIITPVAPSLPPKHDKTRWWGYTSYWNLADYSAAVFPVGLMKTKTLQPTGTFEANSSLPKKHMDSASLAVEWDQLLYDSVPVCLQLVGRRLQEEKVLGMLNVVEEALGGQGPSECIISI